MENNETWCERFSKLRIYPAEMPLESIEIIRVFFESELLTLADNIGAEKQTQEWVNAGENTLLRKQHQVGFNKGLDTAISIIKEMVK